jgi:hypothetical protein
MSGQLAEKVDKLLQSAAPGLDGPGYGTYMSLRICVDLGFKPLEFLHRGVICDCELADNGVLECYVPQDDLFSRVSRLGLADG